MARRDRRRPALGRRPPGSRARARRRARRRGGAGSRRRSARTRTSSATVGTAYVRGLQSAGVVATAQALRRLLGLARRPQPRARSRSAAASSPTCCCRRSRWRCARAASAASCTPTPTSTACRRPPTARCSPGCCATTWGFDGTVVADYFGVAFLQAAARRRRHLGEAAGAALDGGHRRRAADGQGLRRAAASRRRRTASSTRRSSTGRCGACCGRRPSSACSTPTGLPCRRRCAAPTSTGRDRSRQRRPRLARQPGARRAARRGGGRAAAQRRTAAAAAAPAPAIAVIGPNADDPYAMLGCYSFPTHVGVQHPGVRSGIEVPTVLEALRAEFPDARSGCARGTSVDGGETDGIADAAARRGIRRRRRARARRPRRPVRPRHQRRGLRRGVARAARRAAAAGRRGAGDRHADACWCCSPGGRTRSALRRPSRARHRAGVLPRRGGRAGDRRRAQRPGEPERAAAGERPGDPRRAAVDLPRPAARSRERRVEHRPDRRVPVRARPRLHAVRVGAPSRATRARSPSTARRRRAPARAQHRRPGRQPRSCSSTCTTRSRRWCARCSGSIGYAARRAGAGRSRRRCASPCRPTWRRSPGATASGSSSPARSC